MPAANVLYELRDFADVLISNNNQPKARHIGLVTCWTEYMEMIYALWCRKKATRQSARIFKIQN